MTLDPNNAPLGTVRSWVDQMAAADAVAFVFPEGGDDLTWSDLRDHASCVATDLTSRGCKKGESVAIMHPNGPEAIKALFGVLYGGFRATMINLAAGPEAIAYALDHSEARFAFVHEGSKSLFGTVAPASVASLSIEDCHGQAELHEIGPSDQALLMYTSGTTGRPKGVVHTHKSLLAGGWTTAVAHELTAKDRGYCVLPIYHINGLCVTVMGALVSGGSLAVVPKFSKQRFWGNVDKTECTWFSVVPTIISHLLHGDIDPTPDTKARLRFGRSASSALAPEVQRPFEERFGVPIVETMGLTETAAQILSNPLPPGERKIGSPGQAYGNEVAILAPDFSMCQPGVEGEIAVRGPNVMFEYLKNPEATTNTFAGDWLRTGDLGRIDEDGYVFVTGRLKELIIKGGENIAPREIDEALYAHPDVIEAAAFARPCTVYGERVEAAVKVRDGSELDSVKLIALCETQVGKFKAPENVHFMEELPKGPSGKIQRLKLAELIPA